MMMTLDYPGTCWSKRHSDALDLAAFAPLAMFGGFPPTVAHAGPANPTATTSSGGTATEKWYAAIEEKMRPGVTRQQAAVMVAKENPTLQSQYVEEYRQQAQQR